MLRTLTILSAFYCLLLLLISCNQRKAATRKSYTTNDSIMVYALFDAAQVMQGVNPDSAYALFLKAGDLAHKKGFDDGVMNYYNYAAFNRCAFKNDFEAGKKLADSAMLYADLKGKQGYKMSANFTMAAFYQVKEEQDSAIKYYLEALKFQPLTNDSSKLEPLYNNLAILLNYQGRYKQAIEYQKKSLNLYGVNDTDALIAYYNNMYRHYMGAKDTVAAKNSMRAGLALSGMNKKWPSENDLFNVAGDYFLLIHQIDSAIYFYTEHLNYTAQLYDSVYLSQPYISLAKAWLADSNYTNAESYLQRAKKLINPEELPLFSQKDYYETAYQIATRNADKNEALVSLKALHNINETFLDKQRNEQLANYEKQVRGLENENTKIENTLKLKQKNTWIIVLSVSCLFLLIIAMLGILYWRKKKLAASEKLSKLQLEAEWQQLKSRMEAQSEERNRISQELHDDLGSTLTSISLAASLLKEQQQSREVDIIARSSSDMATRMNEIVWSLNTDNDNVQSLVSYIRKFCSTFLKDAEIKFVFKETVAEPHYEIKGFIRRNVFHTVKEAINNIVRHSGATEVMININADADQFSIRISDNGKGFKGAPQQAWNNGLRNMRRNIESIKGSIQWLVQNGTEVCIQTPLKM